MADQDYRRMQEVLARHDFHFKKKYGQNFLTRPQLLNDIADGAKVTESDTVIEIGPGAGTLTRVLAERAKRVIAIEIDERLIPVLDETLADCDNVTVINADILKLDLDELVSDESVKVVANLPYYITTPIIMGLLEKNFPFENITVMVQKEVAERMEAVAGSKDYGALSLAVEYYTRPQILFYVPPEYFVPRPKVGSAVISLEKKDLTDQMREQAPDVFTVIRAAFNQRRKSMVNALSNAAVFGAFREEIAGALEAAGLEAGIRAEKLTLDDFIRLTECLKG